MNDVFILATGYSLANITQEERDYIKTCPTIGVGHLLTYHELIDIVPDHFLLVGEPQDHPSRSIGRHGLFYNVAEIIKEKSLDTIVYARESNLKYVRGDDYPWDSWCPDIVQWSKRQPLPPKNPKLRTQAIDCSEQGAYGKKTIWAETLDDKFFFNSSIATAINLACVLHPGYNIKLVGNDGGVSGKYFYTERDLKPDDISIDGEAVARWANGNKPSKKNIHYNNLNYSTVYCSKQCEKSGNTLYNTNKMSWFTDDPESNLTIFEENKSVFQSVGLQLKANVQSFDDARKTFPNLFNLKYQSIL